MTDKTNQRRKKMENLTVPQMVERKDAPGSWGVEQFDSDGGCLLTIFSGPSAKERADKYLRDMAASDD